MNTLRIPRFIARLLKRVPGSGSRLRTVSLVTIRPVLQPVPVKETASRPRSGFIL